MDREGTVHTCIEIPEHCIYWETLLVHNSENFGEITLLAENYASAAEAQLSLPITCDSKQKRLC